MASEQIEAINALLAQTESAHGVYESTELNGVYDREWPRWYGSFAIEHGLGAVLGRDVTADEVAQFLSSRYAEFERTDPKPVESWGMYIARRMAEEL